ncbi:MAG TPA: sulfatase [Xanthomonadaceae bacterium]|nr:sulfatase [Xanthomonadaceae bacterium]
MSPTSTGGVGARLLTALVAVVTVTNCVPTPRPPHPNVIVILVDDVGWRDLGAYGSELYRTPAIDALAASGLRFTQAYASSPLCSASRASLLTGQSPARLRLTGAAGHLEHEVLDPGVQASAPADRPALEPESRTRLPQAYVTYAEALRAHGYRTAFLGKWHLGHAPYLPEAQGFDLVVGGRAHSGPPPPGYFGPWQLDTLPKVAPGTHIADALTDRAIEFMKANRERPFLLNLWFYDVHAPFQASPERIAEHAGRVRPESQQRSPTMAAMIETLDRNVGRLLAALTQLGLDQNTIIVFTSDNGGNMYDRLDGVSPTSNHPLRAGKGSNYEGGVRVPLIVRWPTVTASGAVAEDVVSGVDLFPTLLEMAALPAQPRDHLDGHSLAAVLRGQDREPRPVFSLFPHYIEATGNLPNVSVRSGRWKLYRFFFDGDGQADRFELYDLEADLGETRNLALERPEVVEVLASRIDAYLRDTGALLPARNPDYRPGAAWVAGGHGQLHQQGDELRLTSTGVDPMLVAVMRSATPGTFELSFEMTSDSAGFGQLFWSDAVNLRFNEADSVRFPAHHDGAWHGYTVRFATRGALRRVRLDPARAPGEIRLRHLRLLPVDSPPHE